jgi:tol-pal system protein YbgF
VKNDPVNDFHTISIGILLLVGANGCATQADLQEQERTYSSLRTQLADNKVALDDVRREVAGVRSEVEEVRHRLDRVAQERADTSPRITVKLLEDRIAVMEQQFAALQQPAWRQPGPITPNRIGEPSLPRPGLEGNPPVARGSEPSPSGAGSLPGSPDVEGLPGAPIGESFQAQADFKRALQAFNTQRYDDAVQQWRAFQRTYPDSEMADDAQYWVGESYFARKDYNRAILEFNDVLTRYRRAEKAPAALLRQAQAFLEIGDRVDARLILQKLVNEHPESEQVAAAKDLLRTLER